MNNLNKEFWNELKLKYPEAMEIFSKWVDTYKRDNSWDVLFNTVTEDLGKTYRRIDYYDLPEALQIGIWIQFVRERKRGYSTIRYSEWDKEITHYFERVLQPESILKDIKKL